MALFPLLLAADRGFYFATTVLCVSCAFLGEPILQKPIFLLLIVIFCLPSFALNPRGPSTLEERQRLVALVHKMEQNPVDLSLQSEKEWALRWLVEVPDITVSICSAPFGKFWDEKYKAVPDHFIGLYTFAMAASVIERPETAGDSPEQKLAQSEAGIKAVLLGYQSLLKTNSKARSKNLDDLVQKENDGKLTDFIRDASAQKCK